MKKDEFSRFHNLDEIGVIGIIDLVVMVLLAFGIFIVVGLFLAVLFLIFHIIWISI